MRSNSFGLAKRGVRFAPSGSLARSSFGGRFADLSLATHSGEISFPKGRSQRSLGRRGSLGKQFSARAPLRVLCRRKLLPPSEGCVATRREEKGRTRLLRSRVRGSGEARRREEQSQRSLREKERTEDWANQANLGSIWLKS